jgi:nucleotide-binding universal stress UspA family protein
LNDRLVDARRRLREAGFSADIRVVNGDPRDALVELVRAEHADLVVMGSHGRTGFAKLVMGSVSSHVVTHAPCSVLVVKADTCVEPTQPLQKEEQS